MTLSRFATPANGIEMTQRLVTALLVAVVLVNGALLFLQPSGHRETTLDHTRDLLQGVGESESWTVIDRALEQFAAAPETPLYGELFFRRHLRFEYPPPALFAGKALRFLERDWLVIADVVKWLSVALTALASAAILETTMRRQPGFVDRPQLPLARLTIVGLLTLTFYPVIKAGTLGHIQVWVDALFALALLCWLWGLRPLGGALIGVVCLIVPHYGLLLLWALLRREWSFFLAGAATAALGLAASVSVFGLSNHLDYLGMLQFLTQYGDAYYANQSVNGLLNRLAGLGDPASNLNLGAAAGKFPPFNPWIFGATLVSWVALVLYGLLRRSAPSERARDFARAALCFTMASPIAWDHHYGILLPIFALLLADGTQGRGRLIAIAIAYGLAANYFAFAQLLAPTLLNPLQSYLFFGAIVVLVLLDAGTRETRSFAARRSISV
jgi:alpha-1,2-mannosyltransferase